MNSFARCHNKEARSFIKFKTQLGVALITVMLIVALSAVIAAQMTARLQLQLQRTANIQLNQQAYWYAMGAEAFTKRVLLMSAKDNEDVTHLGQQWAAGYTKFPVAAGEISGEIKDLHSCLNLNAIKASPTNAGGGGNNAGNTIQKAPPHEALEALIVALNIDGIAEFEAEFMADALFDWLDSNDAIVSAGGAEDNDYASKEFPYLAANNYLASINELRLVEHFTVPVIEALKAFVCVIPDSNEHKININTLDVDKPELLHALIGVSVSEASEILEARDEKGFEEIGDFYNMPEMLAAKLTDDQKQQFVVDSEYFTLSATASFSNSFFTLNSTLKVLDNKEVLVMGRTIGRL